MEIILTKDVENLGQYGEIKKVKSGYARNYLIPQGLASLVTEKVREKVEREKEKYLKERDARIKGAEDIKSKLDKLALTFKVKTTDGKMFGSVTHQDIAGEIFSKAKLKVDKRDVEVDKIHELGNFEAKIKLGEGKKAVIKIKVEGEENVSREKK